VGASRARLARQLVTEGLLLAVTGAGLGLLLARWLSRFLVSFLTTGNDPTFVAMPHDFRIFGFTAALAVLTCLVFESMPVLRAARTDPGEVLKSGARSLTQGRERHGLRRTLVASQIAVSLVLLMGTLLFVRSLRKLETVDPGFQTRGMLVMDVNFSGLSLPPGRAVSFQREILDRVRSIPGVEAAAQITILPLTGANWNNRFWMDGSDLAHARVALRSMIGTEYFRTFRTTLVAGREFDERDQTSVAKVAIVNEEFTREVMGGVNAVGKRIWVEPTPYVPQTALEIVGVVKNAKYRDLREEFQPVVFVPMSQAALERAASSIMIRSRIHPDTLVRSLRTVIVGISPDLRYSFRGFNAWVEDSLLRERLMATLSGLFGVLAVLLTAVGLYGVISYTVTQRTNEIGIRIALGADRRMVIALILRETAVVLAAGLGAGTLLTRVVGRAAATLLFGLEPYDPLTLLIAGISLAVLAGAASYLPAWRAASVNPVIALRQD
jgi:predicted permease